MMLTPLDIQNKQFPRSVRGYNENEVEEFMALIVRSMEELIQVNIDTTSKMTVMEEQLDRYKAMENTIHDAMVLAQKTSEDMIQSAHERSSLIIEKAEEQARKLLEDANKDVIDTIRRHEAAKHEYRAFGTKFKVLLESQLKLVDEMISRQD